MGRRWRLAGFVLLGVAIGPGASGQAALGSAERERRRELENLEAIEKAHRLEMKKAGRRMKAGRGELLGEQPALERIFGDVLDLQYGGWNQNSYFEFSTPGTEFERRAAVEHDFRLYANLEYQNIHQLFARVRASYLFFKDGRAFRQKDPDWDGPRLDQGFYRILVHDALDRYFDRVLPFEMGVTAGRQLLTLGSGLVYRRVEDAVTVEMARDVLKGLFFVAKTIRHNRDIDPSKPVPSNSKRHFLGAELAYEFKVLRVYADYLLERDKNDKDRPDQAFDYHAQYAAAGIGGPTYFFPDLLYRLEVVHQWGKSSADGTTTQERIEAYAALATLRYTLPVPGRPTLEGGYIFGSGDPDRSNVLSTIGGNRRGTRDRNFLYFGYVDTGLALIPRVSNIHILNAYTNLRAFDLGGLERPLGHLDVGLKFFSYWKADRDGVISDPRSAGRTDRWLGMEVDILLQWQIFSDLTLRSDIGVFLPRNGIKDGRSSETYFRLSMIVNF